MVAIDCNWFFNTASIVNALSNYTKWHDDHCNSAIANELIWLVSWLDFSPELCIAKWYQPLDDIGSDSAFQISKNREQNAQRCHQQIRCPVWNICNCIEGYAWRIHCYAHNENISRNKCGWCQSANQFTFESANKKHILLKQLPNCRLCLFLKAKQWILLAQNCLFIWMK